MGKAERNLARQFGFTLFRISVSPSKQSSVYFRTGSQLSQILLPLFDSRACVPLPGYSRSLFWADTAFVLSRGLDCKCDTEYRGDGSHGICVSPHIQQLCPTISGYVRPRTVPNSDLLFSIFDEFHCGSVSSKKWKAKKTVLIICRGRFCE